MHGGMNVEAGDVIWIVTLTEERELFLAGKLTVGDIVEYEGAVRRLPNAGLWQAEYYAFPQKDTEEYLRKVEIHHLAADIRFEGDNDRFILRNGRINPQQLRSIRKLTQRSVELLEEAFYTVGPFNLDDLDPEARVNVLKSYVEVAPDDPTAHYNLAVALGEIGEIDESIASLERAIELDPEYFPTAPDLGRRLEFALQYFDRQQ